MLKSNRIYLDYAASVGANPSSIHSSGVEAKTKLENARKSVSDILNARPSEIIFTSGGTESNNLAILGLIYSYLTSPYRRGRKKEGIIPHIVTTNIEHASVLETCKYLEKTKQARVTYVEVEQNGVVDPKKIKKAITQDTVLVSVMYANNEIGTIQPIQEIAKEIRHYRKGKKYSVLGSLSLRARGALPLGSSACETPQKEYFLPFLHTDAVQAVNYLDLDITKLGVDMLTLSGSKIEGAGRVGVLYKKKSVPLASLFYGGDQEFGLRPGTENVDDIIKFSKAFLLTQSLKDKETKRLTKLRDYFFKSLIRADRRIVVNGDMENRLPNNVNITIPNIPSDLLVIELSARGIMVSAKSACKQGDGKASHVLQAINKQIKDTDGSVRFSMGRDTTKKDIDHTIKALKEILQKLKKWYT